MSAFVANTDFASQLWLFMYAPLNGLGIQVSMGYFLFPLVMVVVGFLLGEYLSRLQWLAVLVAGTGVMVEILQANQIGLATFWVCGTYPIYYFLRRKQKIRALTGLFIDTSIIAPICLYLLFYQYDASLQFTNNPIFWIKVIGLGLISVLALQFNLEANRLLPTSLFGVLSYLEPVFLFIIAVLFLNETFSSATLISFGLIWLGVVTLLFANLSAQKTRKYT
ncbi:MAG: EamA family transporter [Moraxella sp.]